MDIDLSALVHLRGCRDLLYIARLLLRNLCFGLTRNDDGLIVRDMPRSEASTVSAAMDELTGD